ncbi:MAG: hypothetical protein ABH803_02580 [Candidatus Micrarchaeota archaeon]
MAKPRSYLQTTRWVNALVKEGKLPWIKALPLATHQEFSIKKINPLTTEKLAVKTDSHLNEFKGTHADYFNTITTDEFTAYLIHAKKLPLGKALYEATISKKISKYFKPEEIKSFIIGNWASWKANQITNDLFKNNLCRDRGNKEKKQETTKHLKMELIKSISAYHKPIINLNTIWGGHKDGGNADHLDEIALNNLHKITEKIREHGINANVNLLFADFHADKINKKNPVEIKEYHKDIQTLAANKGFTVTKLSDFWLTHNPYAKQGENPEEAKDSLNKAITAMKILEDEGISAIKTKKHYSGSKQPEEAFAAYTTIRNMENSLLEKHAEPGTIFLSFSNPRQKETKENEPENTIHFSPIGHKENDLPWFTKGKPIEIKSRLDEKEKRKLTELAEDPIKEKEKIVDSKRVGFTDWRVLGTKIGLLLLAGTLTFGGSASAINQHYQKLVKQEQQKQELIIAQETAKDARIKHELEKVGITHPDWIKAMKTNKNVVKNYSFLDPLTPKDLVQIKKVGSAFGQGSPTTINLAMPLLVMWNNHLSASSDPKSALDWEKTEIDAAARVLAKQVGSDGFIVNDVYRLAEVIKDNNRDPEFRKTMNILSEYAKYGIYPFDEPVIPDWMKEMEKQKAKKK